MNSMDVMKEWEKCIPKYSMRKKCLKAYEKIDQPKMIYGRPLLLLLMVMNVILKWICYFQVPELHHTVKEFTGYPCVMILSHILAIKHETDYVHINKIP
jgi:hypothetical protein